MAALTIGKPYEWKKIEVDEDILREYEAVYESENKDFRWYAEAAPAGEYYYLIEFEGFSYTGFITVVK